MASPAERDELLARVLRPHLSAYRPYASAAAQAPERAAPSGGRLLKLDANENPYGPSPRVLAALADVPLHRYPDDRQQEARHALAEYTGVPAEHIVLGNGSDDLISLLMLACVGPGDEVVACDPTFSMFRVATTAHGGQYVAVPLTESFDVDVEAVERAITERTKLVFLCSPNNPTGNRVPPDIVRRLLEKAPLLVVDEAYYEFCGQTVAPWVAERRNLAVLRTFSKWAGLAGLRVGYGLFPAPLAETLMALKNPYNVSVVAQRAVVESLADRAYLEGNVRRIIAERERMAGLLQRQGTLQPLPSAANFLLCFYPRGDAQALRDQLAARGILVRAFPDEPRLRGYLRISVGLPEETEQLLQAIEECTPTS
jgi:histidinol-phosphate aminotransferase